MFLLFLRERTLVLSFPVYLLKYITISLTLCLIDHMQCCGLEVHWVGYKSWFWSQNTCVNQQRAEPTVH